MYMCVYVYVCVLGLNGGEPVALLQVATPAPHRPLPETCGWKALVGGGALRPLQGRGPSQGLGVTHFHLLGSEFAQHLHHGRIRASVCMTLLLLKHGKNLK